MLKQYHWRWTKAPFARRLFAICRWLHVYLSTALFALLLFFSLSGFTLNHASWFTADGAQGVETFPLEDEVHRLLLAPAVFPTEQLTAYIDRRFGLKNPRSIDLDLELGEVSLDYPLPAGYAFITVFIDSKALELEYRRGSIVALLNDLHKGRASGAEWSLLIDLSAIVMALFSIAGLVILLQHKKYRSTGLLAVAIGMLFPVALYFCYVPSY